MVIITMQSMQSDDESIVLQAIEFWSSVCEREIKITDAETEAYELKTPCSVKCLGFAHQICKDLVPVLFWFLTQQDEDMDEDEWSPAMAASTCLNLLSQCVGPEIVTYALPLIEQHLRNSDWHHREAAVMLFGCILEGTTSEQQSKLVVQALPFLLALTQDAHIQIRDTSFWTLGRICEFVIQDLPQTLYPDIMTALVRGLTEPSRVTISSSWSLMLFAESTMSSNPHIDTNAVSPFFETVVTALMQLSAREDLTKTARTSAYEALAAWISASANDTVPKLNLVAQEIVRRLEFTLSTITTFSDPVQELLSNFISVLSSLIRRLGKDVAPASDTFMQLLFRVLEVTSKPVDENQEYPSIQEDVLLCIGSVANSLELQFQRYSDSLIPFLVQALSHHEYHALCTVAVGVVADVARALEGHFLPYTQGFMEVLGKHLANPQLQLSVKLAILTCFGDIALAIGGEAFEPYLPVVMHILIQVCTAPEFMPTLQDSLESIRESSIEALVGIVQAFSACHKLSLMLPWIQFILGLIYSSIQSKNNVDHHSRNMAGLLGDIAVGLGKDVKEALLQPWVYEYLSMLVSTRLYSSTTRDTAKWARDRIRAM
ncbi:karyopherin beta [Coelomomyces lativittatus]|nr:karyopherin beta [Coelomomyces lativittatus]